MRFSSNNWTWEGHILGLFNFNLLYFLIEKAFDYRVFKIEMENIKSLEVSVVEILEASQFCQQDHKSNGILKKKTASPWVLQENVCTDLD